MTDLGAFLLAQGSKRRIPGVHDCATMPADWAMQNGWPDPMAAWRSAYDTEEDALRLITESGGLCAMFDAGMSSVGISRHRGEPAPGDVGVIGIIGQSAGAIYAGKRWALVADRGLAFGYVPELAIQGLWRVHG